MAEEQEGPFHLSKTSNGEANWFSAYDPASGVSIPGKSREEAEALVHSINRACVLFAKMHPQGGSQ
ncbi:hypothetical protein [Salipiger sp. PrR003]|uniref:hypothetical protein n=1 Tax=Salipiger sp. PrR003 TaxID=2706776 RepID=UPI0013D90A24|nr:hypothetical protein [Salipiger sp. PrR003]NDV50115.1 hypothetical protein [Salipiger sp. PrR003]